MPSCRPDVIPGVLNKLLEIAPRTLLDVGVGYGKWGVLCTEYLKYWKSIEPVIDGVEIFSDYRSPVYQVYREIFHNDVMNLLDRVGGYDLVLMVDVIEHLSKEDGLRLLQAAKRYVVSTPGYWSDQGSCFGNEHERHVSQWHSTDFSNHQLVHDDLGRIHILGWK